MTATDLKTSELESAALTVDGMDCASCVSHVQRAAGRVPGVEACDVNLARGRAVVRFDPSRASSEQIAAAVSASGYPSKPEPQHANIADVEAQRIARQTQHARDWFHRAMAGIALWFPVELLHWIQQARGVHPAHGDIGASVGWIEWLSVVTSTMAIAYVGAGFYRNAFAALRRKTTDMDVLIAMGASVAYVYSLIALVGFLMHRWHALPDLYFMESSGLLALISLGHWLEARARSSAGKSIHELLSLTPATAIRMSGDAQEEVAVAQLRTDEVILVRPGDRVPIDGVVISGRSSIDESMISGEPLPVARTIGDEVIGGTINQDGALHVRVTKVGAETALAQIVKLVETAQSSKPAVQKLADQIAAIFVPAVLVIALLTAIGWYAWGTAHQWERAHTWAMLAKSVCSVLIIACPCALGLAVPAALMVGTGRGAKLGILFRDIDALQHAETINTVVLDKTGTLTRGKPVVGKIETFGALPEDDVLALAASAEQFSEHPLAKAIVSAARERGLKLRDPSNFKNEPGLGVAAQIDGVDVHVGNHWFVRGTGGPPGASPDYAEHGRAAGATTDVRISRGGQLVGIVALADEIKPDSPATVAQLHALDLRTVLLTGDHRGAADAIAQQAGIADVRADVRPDMKAAAIRELQSSGSRIAMVGDGINDAPALAQADLGIAIGTGSDIAKQTSDVVLVGGSLRGIATTILLSRATMRTIRQNLFFAFLYNVLAIPLAAFGLLNPLIAAAAMALSDVTVIGNALLLRRTKID